MQTPIEWLPAQGAPEQLILLLHGWGADGMAMAPLAQALRSAFPQAALLAPDAPWPVDGPAPDAVDVAGDLATVAASGAATVLAGGGRQWYSIADLAPLNWPERVAAALPPLQQWVHAQQRRLGVGAAATAIAGFSQGAVLALALASHEDGIAGRVLAFGGCYAQAPAAAPKLTTVHLFHGAADTVIPADGSRQALAWLDELRGDATLDIAQGVGHVLHPALIDCALHRLRNHIPLRTWQAAMGAVPQPRHPNDEARD